MLPSKKITRHTIIIVNKGAIMGTYGLDGVLIAWKTGKLTTEQAVGQMLQLLQEIEQRLAKLEQVTSPPRPPAPPRRRRHASEE
jgi:hypothetical protein